MRIKPILLLLGLATTGCTPNDATFGGAVRHNVALQTLDPDPQYKDGGALAGDSGMHAAKAIERYRKGQVIQPIPIQTTSGTGSGSSSGK